MKRHLFLIAALLASALLHAGTVTKQEAHQRAAQFLAARYDANTAKELRMSMKESQEAYYIFNVGSDEGFVIVSADDRTPSVLGYSDSGTFDPDNLPDNFRAWLDGYAEEMKCLSSDLSPFAVQGDLQSPNLSSPRKAPVIRHSISPLLTTTWNQNAPYNRLLLDTLEYSDKCFTGCVATAMAQLLNYHAQRTGKPEGTTANIPAYITGNLQYRVKAVEQGTSIDWANMQNNYYPNAVIRTEQQH